MIREEAFGDCRLYTLANDELELKVTDLGATVVSLRYRGRETVLGYDSPALYREKGAYLGAAIGRYANRIGGAAFTLNGKRYELPANEGKNQLHGGPASFEARRWQAEERDDALVFRLFSPDGDNGYPGNLNVSLRYSLDGAVLRLDFEADSDADTVFAPTSHMYFDLSGRGRVLDARLWVNADAYLEVDAGLIPTGRLLPTEGDFAFDGLRLVERDYDHCFVLRGEHACAMEDGGVCMDVYTDLPAVQIYTGAFLPPPHAANAGLAIEPEFYPDSPNRPEFPSTLLRAGEHFHRWAEYRFSTEDARQ